jgi:hypothetical protein
LLINQCVTSRVLHSRRDDDRPKWLSD